MIQDIAEKHFWDKIPFLKPYALLARWDRPIGFWLLYWPCAWGLVATPQFAVMDIASRLQYLLLFLIGAIVMRGAGCTLNDMMDRKLDAQVARTRVRPLASGQVKLWQAGIFLVLQLAVGALILLQLSPLAIILGLCTLPLIATYPLMKRITWWPQFFLGLNFNSGALIGWAALENSIGWPPVLLYLGGICWTIAYDTVYAHMDTADDALIGIKSTALHWGPQSKNRTGWLFLVAFLFFTATLIATGAGWVGYVMLYVAAMAEGFAFAFWHPENAAYSLRFFRFQHLIGLLIALGLLAPVLF